MAFGRYSKGSRTERELIKLFQEKGFSVIRSAGSGVGTPSPDILVFRHGRQYGFECKAWDRGSLNLDKKQVEDLKIWGDNTGITTMIAWRISRVGWRFAYLSELQEREKSYSITKDRILLLDINMEQLAGD